MDPQNSKDVEKLIFHYKEAIRIDSTYRASYNNLGSTFLNFRKDYDKAIFYCEKAVSLDSNYLEVHFNLAYAYRAKGQVDKSMSHFIRVIEINPDYTLVYPMYNETISETGRLEEGIGLLEKAAQNTSKPANIYLNIGNLYASGGYNIEQSIVYFIKAFDCDKSNKELCNHIATLYKSIGEMEKSNFYYLLCNG